MVETSTVVGFALGALVLSGLITMIVLLTRGDGDDDPKPTPTNLMSRTLAASPSIQQPGAPNPYRFNVNAVDDAHVQAVFAFQCVGGNCPASLTDAQQPAFASALTSLVGLVDDANRDMIVAYEAGTPIVKDPLTIKLTTSGGVGDKYVIPVPNAFNRHAFVSGVNYVMNGNAHGDGRFVCVPWRKSSTYSGGTQLYTTGDIIAINRAFSDGAGGRRAICIMNTLTRRFLYKDSDGLVAGGQGGFFGTYWAPGQYFARRVSGSTIAWESAVDSKTQTKVGTVDDLYDDTLRNYFKGQAIDPGSYLGITGFVRTDLAAFTAFFLSSTPFAAIHVPTANDPNFFNAVG